MRETYEEIKAQIGGHPDTEAFLYDGYGHSSFGTALDYKECLFRFLLS